MLPIPGFPLYFVSPDGDIYSLRSHKFMQPSLNNGYPVVSVTHNKKKKQIRIHRIVAQLYIPNPQNLPIVNHIDHNRTNCKVENLEWTTDQGNATAFKLKRRNAGENHPNAKLDIQDVDLIHHLALQGLLQSEIAVKFGLHEKYISCIIRGQKWKHIAKEYNHDLKRQPRLTDTEVHMIHKYTQQGKSTTEIMKLLGGRSRKTICDLQRGRYRKEIYNMYHN